jgi:O-antigen ligase
MHAFTMLAFSVFGTLFAMRPISWLPTLIVLGCALWLTLSSSFRKKVCSLTTDNDWKYIIWPFFSWFVICLFIGLWHLGWAPKTFPENAFRMALTITTLALATHVYAPRSYLIGLFFASFCVALSVVYGCLIGDRYYPRISGTTNHPIHFGNLATLLAVLLFSAAMLARSYSKTLRVIFFVGALLACGAAAASQSRSSVGVLLCLLPLIVMAKTDKFHRWAIRLAAAVALVALVVVATNSAVQVSLRLKEAAVDMQQVEANNYRTSIGARFAMWHAGWLMFAENPLLGIGPGKFQADFGRRVELGEVPMGDVVHGQPHNDLLHSASSGGLLKLVAYLFLMAGPFVFFYKKYKVNRHDLDKRVFPIMGMQVVAAFFITGLTNSNFDLQIYSTTYAVLVCVLARLSVFEINAAEPSTLSSPAAPNC